jgi:hypothetical protein
MLDLGKTLLLASSNKIYDESKRRTHFECLLPHISETDITLSQESVLNL